MAKKKIEEISKLRCRDCANSYDWSDRAHDGHLILCRCKLDKKTEYGKWCKMLSDYVCEHFKIRPKGN